MQIEKENGIDDHDHYGDPDVPRSDDLYKRCEHGLIANECGTCEYGEVNYCPCGNESRYNPRCDECTAKCRQVTE
jgi:hypothetical protein